MLKIQCAPLDGRSGSPAAYALLEGMYRAAYGGAVPEIKKTPNGKPFFPARPGVHFSLSHAKTHVLCALSDCPVGVDIESPRVISQRAVNFFCAPGELAVFEPIDLWVLKESYIKLIGGTLAMMRRLRFSCESGRITACRDEYLISNGEDFPNIPAICGNSVSGLYNVGGCRAAVSVYSVRAWRDAVSAGSYEATLASAASVEESGPELPCSIELI